MAAEDCRYFRGAFADGKRCVCGIVRYPIAITSCTTDCADYSKRLVPPPPKSPGRPKKKEIVIWQRL